MASPDSSRVEPIDEIDEIDRIPPMARLRRLFRYVGPYKVRLGFGLVCLALGSGLGLVYPEYLGRVIDAAFTDRDVGRLNATTLTLVALFAAQAAFVFLRHYLITWVGLRAVLDLRIEVYRRIVTLSQSFFHEKRTGALLSRLGDDVSRLHDTVSSDLSMGLRNGVTLIGGVTILVVKNPQLTAVMLAVVPPLAVATVLLGRVIRKIARKAQDQLATANAELAEGIAGIETVQAYTREQHELSRYRGSMQNAFGLFVRRTMMRAIFAGTASFLAFSALAGIFWYGGKMVANGDITGGALMTFMLYTVMVAGAVAGFSDLWAQLQHTFGSTARIFEILDTEPEIDDRDGAVALSDVHGEIRFEGVDFTYPGRDQQVVQNVDLTIRPGQSCALVGSSGSGKTTLGRLLFRFYDPTAGRVTLDGEDLRDIQLASLREHMALVSQDPVLFSGSIRDNIRYGRLDASDAEVEAAARAANAHDFIEDFPKGYDTEVGERGQQLSGGQRQRVSIARAILRDPPVLVLDEATSALDAESEALVQQALDTLQADRTTLIIAHRLSTIRDADTICVLEHGRIVERGKHAELLARSGAYAKLVARQTQGPQAVPA